MSEHIDDYESTKERRAPVRRPRNWILEMMLLVAALAVSFRWPGLSVPVGLLFLYALAQRRDILGQPTRVALAQIALALYLPPAVGIFLVSRQERGFYLEHFSLMPNFIPGALIARMLPWFDWFNSPPLTVEIVVLSAMTSLAMIRGLGVLARRGIAWRMACLTLAMAMSAASTFFLWLLLHAGA
jgi:hypothetical protein